MDQLLTMKARKQVQYSRPDVHVWLSVNEVDKDWELKL